jgi:hypothetical protein
MSLQKFIAFARVSRFEKTVEPGTTYFDVAGISDKIVHDGPRETDFRLNYNEDSHGGNIVIHDVHAPFGEGKFAAELKRESKRFTKLLRRIAWEEILALPPYPEGMFVPDETVSPKQILASRFAKGELLRFGGGNGPTWLKERDEWVDEPLVSGSIYSIFHAEDSGGRFGEIEKTRYLTPESDILCKEYQKRVIFQLAKEGLSVGIKLVDVCDSGKKSIHPTFRISKGDFQKDEEKPIGKETVERFIARCEQLGADSATLHPNAVARIPNASRQVIPDFVDPSTLPPGTSKCKKQTLLFWRPEGFVGQAVDLPLMEQMALDADLDDPDEVDEVILPADGTGECPGPENDGQQPRVECCRVQTGAGTVVTKDVPPYTIVGGLPARIIRRRVDPEVEQALTRIVWWNWSHEQIKDTLADFRKLDAKGFALKYDR